MSIFVFQLIFLSVLIECFIVFRLSQQRCPRLVSNFFSLLSSNIIKSFNENYHKFFLWIGWSRFDNWRNEHKMFQWMEFIEKKTQEFELRMLYELSNNETLVQICKDENASETNLTAHSARAHTNGERDRVNEIQNHAKRMLNYN